MNRILVVGSGSIGIRHIRALKAIGERNLFALRTLRGHIKMLPSDIKDDVREIFNEKEAVRLNPTHVIISNPTSLHLRYIKKFINGNTKIFVEKPIASNFKDIDKLGKKALDKIRKNKGMVGFNLRFHKIFHTLKKIIKDRSLGRPLYASLNVGHYLPFWHPYEDYRKSYAARRKLGGGVLRTLSHELDLVQFLFGPVKSLFAGVGKLSKLQIDVDDCVDIICEAEICERVKVHMDYLWPLPKRTGEILFEKALIEYDFFSGKIYRTDHNSRRRKLVFRIPHKYNRDEQYRAQMRDFLSPASKIGCALKEGIVNLKIIDLCEKSQKERKTVCLS